MEALYDALKKLKNRQTPHLSIDGLHLRRRVFLYPARIRAIGLYIKVVSTQQSKSASSSSSLGFITTRRVVDLGEIEQDIAAAEKRRKKQQKRVSANPEVAPPEQVNNKDINTDKQSEPDELQQLHRRPMDGAAVTFVFKSSPTDESDDVLLPQQQQHQQQTSTIPPDDDDDEEESNDNNHNTNDNTHLNRNVVENDELKKRQQQQQKQQQREKDIDSELNNKHDFISLLRSENSLPFEIKFDFYNDDGDDDVKDGKDGDGRREGATTGDLDGNESSVQIDVTNPQCMKMIVRLKRSNYFPRDNNNSSVNQLQPQQPLTVHLEWRMEYYTGYNLQNTGSTLSSSSPSSATAPINMTMMMMMMNSAIAVLPGTESSGPVFGRYRTGRRMMSLLNKAMNRIGGKHGSSVTSSCYASYGVFEKSVALAAGQVKLY